MQFAETSCLATERNGVRELLRDLAVGPEIFAEHLKMHLFRVGFLMEHTLFVGCVIKYINNSN